MWPENRPAVEAFLLCSTQWRRAGASGLPTGLDYGGVEAALRLAGIEADRALFEQLRTIELGALEAWAERRRQ